MREHKGFGAKTGNDLDPVYDRSARSSPFRDGDRDLAPGRPAFKVLLSLQQMVGNRAVAGVVRSGRAVTAQRQPEEDTSQPGTKEYSARFEGDSTLADVASGAVTLGVGSTGLAVTKLQQALLELGHLAAGGVTGTFNSATETALRAFQKAKSIPESGKFDADTLKELNSAYDTRAPYVGSMGLHDPAKPGTHALSPADRAAALAAMVPAPAVGAPLTFKEDLGPPKGKYGPRIDAELTTLISSFHKSLYSDKKPLRADPAKNFHSWTALEAPAEAAKSVVDAMYGSQYGGPPAKPAMTHVGGNLIDQWTDEIAANAALTASQKKQKAEGKLWYLIDSNCADISREHSAVPSRAAERAILAPIVTKFVSTPGKVQTLLDLDIGWKGAQLEGKVYLQRYRSTNPDKAKAKEADRVQMWQLFHTCIHEYLHTLAHKDFNTWAETFRAAGDETRYNTLVEGFCDFFTMNVRSTLAPLTVQAKVEGPYANGKPPPPISPAVYPSNQQAEQIVSVVGIKNAQRAYFNGETKLMGSP